MGSHIERALSLRPCLALSAAACLSMAAMAQAQVVYETSFERPDFTAGEVLEGQGGWFIFLVGSVRGAETITTERAFGGDQAVRLDSTLVVESITGTGISEELDPTAFGQTQAVLSAYVYVEPGVGDDEAFGLQVFAERDPVTGLLPANAAAGINQQGEILTNAATGSSGIFVGTDRWVFLELVVDIPTATFGVRADGATVLEGLPLLEPASDGTVGGLAVLQTAEGRGDSVGFIDQVTLSAASPCAPDIDRDGLLTIFDFLAFQNLFDAGDPAADFDADGTLTLFDFLAFQNAFDAGCE